MKSYIDALKASGTGELRDICSHLKLPYADSDTKDTLAERISSYVTRNPKELKKRLPYSEQMALSLHSVGDDILTTDFHTVTILERLKMVERVPYTDGNGDTSYMMFLHDDLKECYSSVRSYRPEADGLKEFQDVTAGFLTTEGAAPLQDLEEALEEIRSVLKETGRVTSVRKFMDESLLISYCRFEYRGKTYLKHPMISDPVRILAFKEEMAPFCDKGISPVHTYLASGKRFPRAAMDCGSEYVADFMELAESLGYDSMKADELYTCIFLAMNEGDMQTVKAMTRYIADQCAEPEREKAVMTISKAYENMPLWAACGMSFEELLSMYDSYESESPAGDSIRRFWGIESNGTMS